MEVLLEMDLNQSNQITLSSQIDHYRFRGIHLQMLNFYEYCSLVLIVPNKSGLDGDDPTRGRPCNISFQFSIAHPLFTTHQQKLRSKPATVMLAGRPIPRYPGPEPQKKKKAWKRKAERFAEYCCILLMPWECGEFAIEKMEESSSWIDSLRLFFSNRTATNSILYPEELHQLRLNIYNHIVQLTSVSSKRQQIMTLWNHRHRTLWNQAKKASSASSSSGNYFEPESQDDTQVVDVVNGIQSLNLLVGRYSQSARSKLYLENQKQSIELFFGATVSTILSTLFRDSNILCPEWWDQDIEQADRRRVNVTKSNVEDPRESESLMGSRNSESEASLDIILSPDQSTLLDHIIATIASGSQFLGCVTGGPGTGKSTFAKALNLKLRAITGIRILNTAPTGVAASLLPRGQTLNSALGIFGTRLRILSQTTLLNFRQKFDSENIEVLLIDEVSMLTSELLAQTHHRLQQIRNNEKNFGGVSIILLGDLFQLEPVGKPVYSTSINSNQPVPDLFHLFSQHELATQHRSIDSFHTKKLETLRKHYMFPEQRIPMIPFLERIKILQSIDRPKFAQATILVASNLERNMLNLVALKNFARRNNLPIFRWRNEVQGIMMTEKQHSDLAENEPILFGYFCPGAPAVITTNINPSNRLANGTPVTLFSLTFHQDAVLPEAFELNTFSSPGEIIDVPFPYSINVKRRSYLAQCSDSDEIIPIFQEPPKEDRKKKKISISHHGLHLSFAMTFHKSQGQTLDRVIVDVNNRAKHSKSLGRISWHALFVALSRVKKSNHIRLLPPFGSPTFSFIDHLHPSNQLIKFYSERSGKN
jgi:hypothetical protein